MSGDSHTARFFTAMALVFVLILSVVQSDRRASAATTSLPSYHRSLLGNELESSAVKVNGKIAFTSTRNGFRDIYVMDSDGGNQRQLTFGSKNPADDSRRANTWGPMWSPDGTKIAFAGTLEYGKYNLYVMNPDGTRITKVFGANNVDVDSVSWSPDGAKLAFSNSCASIDGSLCPIDIYTINVDGSVLMKLTNNQAGAEDLGPAWSPDGTKIAFAAIRSDDFTSIYVMSPDGTNRLRLTSASYDNKPAWSPDGAKIAFNRGSDVYVMN